jgi:hypothetical protein
MLLKIKVATKLKNIDSLSKLKKGKGGKLEMVPYLKETAQQGGRYLL